MELLKIGFWNGGERWRCANTEEEVDSSRKYVAFLVFNAEFLGKSLKLGCSFDIIGLELYRSVSRKVSKRAEMPFVKLNGKSRVRRHR